MKKNSLVIHRLNSIQIENCYCNVDPNIWVFVLEEKDDSANNNKWNLFVSELSNPDTNLGITNKYQVLCWRHLQLTHHTRCPCNCLYQILSDSDLLLYQATFLKKNSIDWAILQFFPDFFSQSW